ncbi:MAG: ImmA/IrrE family metallo-endopeptidase [Alphaproteobacteria bacterium]|nr:ImmA/IrrE family metallo-endopeptidase [Alphaproteobacteria bacterium]
MNIEDIAREYREASSADVVSIDPVRLAQKLRIEVYNVDTLGAQLNSVVQKFGDGHIKIFVNQELSPAWKRFAIAKELAHIILESEKMSDPSMKELLDELVHADKGNEDDFASALAAAILLDPKAIATAWKKVRDIHGVAALFQVPEVLVVQRLRELGLFEAQK